MYKPNVTVTKYIYVDNSHLTFLQVAKTKYLCYLNQVRVGVPAVTNGVSCRIYRVNILDVLNPPIFRFCKTIYFGILSLQYNHNNSKKR